VLDMMIDSHKGLYTVEFDEKIDINKIIALGTHFIVDANVQERLGTLPNMIVITAEESQKSYDGATWIIEALIKCGLNRESHLVAIGGGITQDITCWIASTFMRGIDWSFVPTTLLAQADSCIGSKSSINFRAFKNMLGTFYPPKHVLIVEQFRTTLSEADIKSGIAEIVKLAIINGDEPDFLRSIVGANNDIHYALHIKKSYIEFDEFDRGIRNRLNYGHCFGHAIETASDYQIPHGIAVAMGMDLANGFSDLRFGTKFYEKYHDILANLYSDFNHILYDTDRVISAMSKDKKNTAQYANIIVPVYETGVIKKPFIRDEIFTKHVTFLLQRMKDPNASL
jgi:3-dehydroquinate synthase